MAVIQFHSPAAIEGPPKARAGLNLPQHFPSFKVGPKSPCNCCSTRIEESPDVQKAYRLCAGWDAFVPGAAGDCPEFPAGPWRGLADSERDQAPADPGRGGKRILAQPAG